MGMDDVRASTLHVTDQATKELRKAELGSIDRGGFDPEVEELTFNFRRRTRQESDYFQPQPPSPLRAVA